MAVTFQLTDGTTTVNFANATGPELEASYLPVLATPPGDGTIAPDITEAIPALIRITSGDNLASTLQDVYRLAEQAAFYTSNKHQTPVWLHRKMNDETSAVRYLVKSISYTPNAQFGGPYDQVPCITDGRTGVFTITHHPYGESTSAIAASGTDDVDVLGGQCDYTNVVGDVDARLYYLHIDNLSGVEVHRQFWMGFRSAWRAASGIANLVTLWELESGTANIDTATADVAGGSPTGGGGANNVMQCDFNPTTTWAERCSIMLSDVAGGNYEEQTGAFVVILRAKVDAGGAQVKIRWGTNISTGVYAEGPTIDVEDTSWTLYNMGVVEWPVRNLHALPTALLADSYDQRGSIEMWARVKPGSSTPGQLDMDCLVMVPCDEYFIHVLSAEVNASTPRELYVGVAPEDVSAAATIHGTSNWITNDVEVSTIGAGIPVGDGRLVICVANADTGTAPAYNSDVDIELSTYPRWIAFRGAE